MKGDDKLFEAPFLTLDEIARRWPNGKLANDMIVEADIEIIGHFGELVCPFFKLRNFAYGLCAGYASTANFGFIIRRVSQLLDLFEDDRKSFLRTVRNTPVRLYSWGHAGDSVMETVCLGNFLDDRFLYGLDLMRTGLPLFDINGRNAEWAE